MNKQNELIVAIVGATGVVGRETIACLEERKFELGELRPLASARSAGESITFSGKDYIIREANEESFAEVDIAFFCAGGEVSSKLAPVAVEQGAIVIDKSSYFRMNPNVPLIVPEVNGAELKHQLSKLSGKGLLVASPNCSTIPLAVVLKPIKDQVGLARVVVSTYQSVSGAGQPGIDELWNQTLGIFRQSEVEPKKFPHQIAFNCIPQIDSFLPNGYTKEEMKVIDESRKILGDPGLKITATAVRVPTFICHAESVNIETVQPLSVTEARELLRKSPGIIVTDDPDYPVGIETGGTDATYVGRIRQDESVQRGLNLWVVADNVRKGAALNAVQIAEIIVNSTPR